MLNKELTELKQEKSRILSNNDSSADIKSTEDLIGILKNGPTKMINFDETIFKDIVKEIKVEENKKLQFMLINNIAICERK